MIKLQLLSGSLSRYTKNETVTYRECLEDARTFDSLDLKFLRGYAERGCQLEVTSAAVHQFIPFQRRTTCHKVPEYKAIPLAFV